MNHRRKNLANLAALIDQITRRSIESLGLLPVEIGHDVERRALSLKRLEEFCGRLEIRVLLRNRNDDRVALFEFGVRLLQLNQLRRTRRSPVRAIRRDDDISFSEVFPDIERLPFEPRQRHRRHGIAELQFVIDAPRRIARIDIDRRCIRRNR